MGLKKEKREEKKRKRLFCYRAYLQKGKSKEGKKEVRQEGRKEGRKEGRREELWSQKRCQQKLKD